MTDKQQPQKNNASTATSETKQPSDEALTGINKNTVKHKAQSKPHTAPTKTAHKTAILALLVALSAGAAVGGLYYWQTQQQNQLTQQIAQTNQQLLQQSKAETQQLLAKQQHLFEQQITKAITEATQAQQAKIAQLETTVARLSQRQPSDWLIHESEYLIRVATRSIWLERDTSAAINLLKDADNRLKQLNNPEFLPVRQLIHQDIEQLKLLPKRETDEVILALMGLSQQINKLPLTKIERLDTTEQQQAFQLSEDLNDWQSNLKKSWQKFLSDFITIRRRDDTVEPLMSPEYQQNLRQNLSLKLQLAQWAANQGKTKIYQAALNDVLAWHQQYFDMDNVTNQKFSQNIQALIPAVIAVDYPKSLSSLQGIHQRLNKQSSLAPLQLKEEKSPNKAVDKNEKIDQKQSQPIAPPATQTTPEQAAKKQTQGAII